LLRRGCERLLADAESVAPARLATRAAASSSIFDPSTPESNAVSFARTICNLAAKGATACGGATNKVSARCARNASKAMRSSPLFTSSMKEAATIPHQFWVHYCFTKCVIWPNRFILTFSQKLFCPTLNAQQPR
jgi:hypothetical protein